MNFVTKANLELQHQIQSMQNLTSPIKSLAIGFTEFQSCRNLRKLHCYTARFEKKNAKVLFVFAFDEHFRMSAPTLQIAFGFKLEFEHNSVDGADKLHKSAEEEHPVFVDDWILLLST